MKLASAFIQNYVIEQFSRIFHTAKDLSEIARKMFGTDFPDAKALERGKNMAVPRQFIYEKKNIFDYKLL